MSKKTLGILIIIGLLFAGAVFINAASRVVDIITVGAIICIYEIRLRNRNSKIDTLKANLAGQTTLLQVELDHSAALRKQITLLENKVAVLPVRKLEGEIDQQHHEIARELANKEPQSFTDRAMERFRTVMGCDTFDKPGNPA